MREALESLLKDRWTNYRRALKQCRNKFSEQRVHALRVEIRRLLSMLTLLEAVLPAKQINPVRDPLRRRLKAFARLRDTHVQLLLVKGMKGTPKDGPELKKFQQFLRRKERRLVHRLTRELKEARHGRLTRRVRRLRHAVRQTKEMGAPAWHFEAALLRAVRHAFDEVVAHYRMVDAAEPATIHRLRVAFKKFRYMAEAPAQTGPGGSGRRRLAMHDYQTRMGEIQDVEVLLARVEKFARKNETSPGALDPLRSELLRRRGRLVKKFMASAEQLWEFRPRPSVRKARARK